jgi:two-component system C4-dicarboxylate transport sensor histidine kinase DctB
MGGIIHPLKGFARKAPASPAITDVGQAVNNALLLFNSRIRSEEVALSNHCPEGHTLAWCDPNRLEQVIVNLIGNALDAMREVTVKTLSLSALPTGDGWIRLTVSDTGSGIPEHLLPRLFEPFFTTKPVGIGLGLGLSISQDIVREFHGLLSAENMAEGGARFVLLLPEKGAHEDTPDPAHWPPST